MSTVFPELWRVGGGAVVLHGLCVLLLVLCLLASCGSILISLYNSISNPYETYMGPIGIYACSSASGEVNSWGRVEGCSHTPFFPFLRLSVHASMFFGVVASNARRSEMTHFPF